MRYLENVSQELQNNLINIKSNYQTKRFIYRLLDKDENFKKELKNVSSKQGSISFSDFLEIKRTGTILIGGLDPDIDFINDRLEILVELGNATTKLIFPLGVLLLSSPVQKHKTNTFSDFMVNIYDKLQILAEDKVISRFVIKKGTVYTNIIQELVNSTSIGDSNIVISPLTAARDITFDAGSSKLFIINELLKQINYYGLYTDNKGIAVAKPKPLEQTRNPEYFYRLDDVSIVKKGFTKSFDLFNVPNVITRVATNPNSEPLTSTYRNYIEDDPTSIQNRGREIDDYQEISDIPNQEALDEFVLREAEEAKKVFNEVTFMSAINPLHEQAECIEINGDTVIESSWTIQLTTEGLMTHSTKGVVYV